VGASGYVSEMGNPPVSNPLYAYKVGGSHDPQGEWLPRANTVNAGTIFTQSRVSLQDYQQSCFIYEQNQYGNVRVRNVGTGAFANSSAGGNSNYFTNPITETQTAIGTKPFIQ